MLKERGLLRCEPDEQLTIILEDSKMNNLQVFTNENFGEVRTIVEGSEVLFCARDIAVALGYAKPENAINQHCKATLKRGILSKGGNQETNFIKEGDVYRLIVKSKLPQAERFERWVFDEVLPTIRKHGVYAVEELLDNPDFAIQALTALKEERARVKELKGKVKELEPKANYCDTVLECKNAIAISVIAKDYGYSALKFNELLHELGVQYKQGDTWLLYQKYAKKGYTNSKTHNYKKTDGANQAKVHTYWTQKGRLFLYELLKKKGILPIVER